MVVDVLNLEWTSYLSRDRVSATLVCNYLRYRGLNVIEKSIFNGFYYINKFKPKILFMTNTTGAEINQEVARYAKSKGIIVVAMISEGNLKDEHIEGMAWGHNKDKRVFEDAYLLWSTRSLSMIQREFPCLSEIMSVTGSVGHDIYTINKVTKKIKTKKEYITVGVGCWGFDYFLNPATSNLVNNEVRGFFLEQRVLFDKTLEQVIKDNKDVHFLLKEHTGNIMGYEGSAIESCVKHPNVQIYKHDKSIFDCIDESDLWVTYDSSTALEAWLLEKQTCMLNPGPSKWPVSRDQMHKSQPIYGTAAELHEAINAVKNKDRIPCFDQFAAKRKVVIRDVIEYSDGLNHVRAGNVIFRAHNNLLSTKNSNRKSIAPSKWVIVKRTMRYILANYLFFLPGIKGSNEFRCRWKESDLQSDHMYIDQLNFYTKENLTVEMLSRYV